MDWEIKLQRMVGKSNDYDFNTVLRELAEDLEIFIEEILQQERKELIEWAAEKIDEIDSMDEITAPKTGYAIGMEDLITPLKSKE